MTFQACGLEWRLEGPQSLEAKNEGGRTRRKKTGQGSNKRVALNVFIRHMNVTQDDRKDNAPPSGTPGLVAATAMGDQSTPLWWTFDHQSYLSGASCFQWFGQASTGFSRRAKGTSMVTDPKSCGSTIRGAG